jgi:hypothetical protein
MDLITAVSYAIAEQDVRLTPKQALFRHYCRYGDSKTLRHLALTLGDELFTSTAVDVYFHTVYMYGTLDMIRTLHELIPGRHHLEAPISNPNDDVVKLYGPRYPEAYIRSLDISRMFRLFPDYETYTKRHERTGYLEVEVFLIYHLSSQTYLKPAITLEQRDILVSQGWKLIPYIVYDAVRGKIKLSRLLKLAIVMSRDYETTRELGIKEQLFYILDVVGLRLMVDIYGKDAVISLIRKFPVVEVIDYIVGDHSLLLSPSEFDVVDPFADKLVNTPYANLIALVTTKPELYLSNLSLYRGKTFVSTELADRLWDNLRFYVKRRPETVVETFENSSYAMLHCYAFQVLWMEGISVDESKLKYDLLDLGYLKVNDEQLINVFLRNKTKRHIIRNLYYEWKRISPYIIDYILRTKGITREEIIEDHEEQERKALEEGNSED